MNIKFIYVIWNAICSEIIAFYKNEPYMIFEMFLYQDKIQDNQMANTIIYQVKCKKYRLNYVIYEMLNL